MWPLLCDICLLAYAFQASSPTAWKSAVLLVRIPSYSMSFCCFVTSHLGGLRSFGLRQVVYLLTLQCPCSFGLSAVRQSSNIYFTNGVYDPFIACGPTVDISDTITTQVYGKHFTTSEGCLCVQVDPIACWVVEASVVGLLFTTLG